MSLDVGSLRNSVRGPALRLLGRNRAGVQMTIDTAAWAVALALATWARYDFETFRVDVAGLALIAATAGLLQIAVGYAFGLYRGRWRFGSFDEVAALARVAVAAGTLLFLVNHLMQPHPVPRSIPLTGGVLALVGMAGARYAWRLTWEHFRRPSEDATSRVLVFGAGEAAAQAVTSMLRDPDSPYLPVGLLDDDHGKRNLRLMGVPMLGSRERIGAAARKTRADTLLIAIPSAGHELVTGVADLAHEAGLRVKVLPPVRELLGANVDIRHIRPLTEADLLGRHEIRTDLASIADYVTGKRVLVTGAGGSIGSELCRQLHRFVPEALVMCDRDESGLHAVQLSIEGHALLNTPDTVVMDIRDRERLEQVWAQHRPEVVFHAAALKHLPLLEQHPSEAYQTNVAGTLNLLEVSARHGVQRFINISTDKAADPTSVLGYSKRVAERLTAHFGLHERGTYLSVRFGNVLGSRGSMLETFRQQIDSGGPLTLTDPEVTRYFMTIEEAVQLVIQAGAIGNDGEALVLDMGEPVRIADVARRLIAQSGQPVEIVHTGLRAGEKLHETLFGAGERDDRRQHPLISHVCVPPLAPATLNGAATACTHTRMRELCDADPSLAPNA